MIFFETLKIVFTSLKNNKARSILASFGVVIGIASVIIVYSAGEGLNGLILNQVSGFGTNIIQVEIKFPSTKKGMAAESEMASRIAGGAQVTTLNLKDKRDIEQLSNISACYAGFTGQEKVSYESEVKKTILWGVSPEFIDVDKAEIDYGRFYTVSEDKSLAQVAVLGKGIKEKLFNGSDPIGKFIKIGKSKYQVIGVLKEKGRMATYDFDEMIYLPVQTMQKKILGINHVIYIMSQVKNLDLASQTAEEIRNVLRENHHIPQPKSSEINYLARGSSAITADKDDFRVTTMSEMMDMLNTITNAITLLLLAIVVISLVVGGVGIMNVMYLIINERTEEIGLRKALGARQKDIIIQFLIETIILTFFGAIIGVILGIGIAYLIAFVARSNDLDWNFSIPLKAYVTSLSFAFLFGILFGVYPARRAAKLNPIEAMRKE